MVLHQLKCSQNSTILELPPEIFAAIFDFAGFDNSPSALINVASVCKEWRNTIYSHPRFWTTLHVEANRSRSPGVLAKDLVDHIHHWFGHSSDLPLTLNVTMDLFTPNPRDMPHLTSYLLNCSRWKALSFKFKTSPDSLIMLSTGWPWLQAFFDGAMAMSTKAPCWDSLKELEIEAESARCGSEDMLNLPLLQVAPNLQVLKLKFRGIANGSLLDKHSVNLENLRHIEIDATTSWRDDALFEFYFRTISQATRLESLTLLSHQAHLSIPKPEFFVTAPSFPVSNVTLHHLTLHDSPAIRWCLQNLRLPSLYSLSLSEPDHSRSPVTDASHILPLDSVFKQLALQSECALKELRLENTPVSDEQLCNVLGMLPTLERLELEFTSSSHLQSTFLTQLMAPPSSTRPEGEIRSAATSPVILPALRSFSYTIGAWHVPLTILRFKRLFRTFVEDPRRWWPVNRPRAAPTSLGRPSEPTTMGAGSPKKRYSRLETAQFLLYRMDLTRSTLYSRGKFSLES